MTAKAKWSAARLRVSAIINGVTYDDEVVQFVSNFALNTIPSAVVVIAPGRNVRTGEPSKIHDNIRDLRLRAKAEVWLEVEPLGNSGDLRDPLTAEGSPRRFRIFDGYAIGFGWQRTATSAQFVLHLQHWLADLHHSSAFSGISHPGNPASFTYTSCHMEVDVGGAGGTDPRLVPQTNIETSVDVGKLESEFWLLVLREWMMQISSCDPIDPRFREGVKNTSAKDALARMTGDASPDFPSKLAMVFEGGDADVIARNIAMSLQQTIGANAANTTLWGKLVAEWAPEYMFAVVPRVEDAILIPFVGALRGMYTHIRLGHYTGARFNNAMPQMLRALAILHPIQFLAGANLNAAENTHDRSGVAAMFPEPPRKSGVIMTKDAPKWLSEPVLASRYSGWSSGVRNDQPSGSAMDKVGTGNPRIPETDPNRSQKEVKPILAQFAHQWYVVEMLRGRFGELVGRLRFDVSPGSQIKIECGSERFVEDDAFGDPLFAMVTQVVTVIDAENQRAETAFSLAYIRTEAEDNDDLTSVASPPLYLDTGWRGTNMVDGMIPSGD